jgi:ketosteroid isomerase-like protein
MAITRDRVREIFKGLENGDGAVFLKHVADDVDWTVMGTHPLAGHYRSKKDFIAGTFAKVLSDSDGSTSRTHDRRGRCVLLGTAL